MTTEIDYSLAVLQPEETEETQFSAAFELFLFRLSAVTEEDFVEEARAIARKEFPLWNIDKKGDIGFFIVRLYIKAVMQAVYLANAWAQEFNIFTAREEASVIAHAVRLGYQPRSNIPSRVDVVLNMPSPLGAHSFDAFDIVMNTKNQDGDANAVFFENEFDFSVGAGISQVVVQMIAGRSVDQEYTATAEDFQSVILGNQDVLDGSVSAIFGVTQFIEVDDLVDSEPTDNHFIVRLRSDLLSEVVFGDGSNGARPPNGVTGTISYRHGGGDLSNIPKEKLDFVFSSPVAGITGKNLLAATGGFDREDKESIRVNAPFQVKTRDFLGKLSDVTQFAESMPGVARAVAQLFGQIVLVGIIPKGGGSATAALLADVTVELNSRLVMGYSAQVGDPAYVAPTVTVLFRTKPGFVSAEVELAVAADIAALVNPLTTKKDPVTNRLLFARAFGEALYRNRVIETVSARPEVEKDFTVTQPVSDILVPATSITTDIGATITATSLNVQTVGFVQP